MNKRPTAAGGILSKKRRQKSNGKRDAEKIASFRQRESKISEAVGKAEAAREQKAGEGKKKVAAAAAAGVRVRGRPGLDGLGWAGLPTLLGR